MKVRFSVAGSFKVDLSSIAKAFIAWLFLFH